MVGSILTEAIAELDDDYFGDGMAFLTIMNIESFLLANNGALVEISESTHCPSGSDYIEGTLLLEINGVTLLDGTESGIIDTMWLTIADMCLELTQVSSTSSVLPDTPSLLSFARIDPGHVLVSVSDDDGSKRRAARVGEKDLLQILRDSGVRFFRKMQQIAHEPTGAYSAAISKLEWSAT